MNYKKIAIILLLINLALFGCLIYYYSNNNDCMKLIERLEPILNDQNNSLFYNINDAVNRDEFRSRADKRKLNRLHNEIVINADELTLYERIRIKLNYYDTLKYEIYNNIASPYHLKPDKFEYRVHELSIPYRSYNDSVYFVYEIGNNCLESAKYYEIIGSSSERESEIGNNSVLFKIHLKDHERNIRVIDKNKNALMYHYFVVIKNTKNNEIDTLHEIKKLEFLRR